MPELNLDMDYFDHPKTRRLVGALGRGADVLPIRLWCYCGKYHAENGEMNDYSPSDLEHAIGWWGQPGRACEALLRPFEGKPGFLKCIENGFKVHNWNKRNGHIQVFRERATQAAKARWEKYATSIAQASPKHATSIALTRRKPSKKPPTPFQGDLLLEFESAWNAYPGDRSSVQADFRAFMRQCRIEAEEVLPRLLPAILREVEHKAARKQQTGFAPAWKGFRKWLTERCWEQEFGEIESSDPAGPLQPDFVGGGAP